MIQILGQILELYRGKWILALKKLTTRSRSFSSDLDIVSDINIDMIIIGINISHEHQHGKTLCQFQK
jgi:hypothetical protein